MNECQVCKKTDAEKPMAFRGMPYCSDLHRKVLKGELTLKTVTTTVVAVPMTNEKPVVE